MRKYLTSYRSIEHPTTGKSPAELLFGHKMRGNLPDIIMNHVPDVAVCDCDTGQIHKAKIYVDVGHNIQT